MSILEDNREKLEAAGEKIKHGFHENVDRLGDKVDEIKANAEVRKAEMKRDSVEEKNEYKEDLRDTT